MTESEFATLAEILKYLNINMLRKSVIGRNEAICKYMIDPEFSGIRLLAMTLRRWFLMSGESQ